MEHVVPISGEFYLLVLKIIGFSNQHFQTVVMWEQYKMRTVTTSDSTVKVL